MDNQSLINYLNQLLSNQFVMYVKLHRYHWYVQGKNFYELHELFENMYTAFAEDLDVTAERVLMIGGKPLATMTKYLKETTLTEANADDKPDEMINQLLQDFQQIIDELKETGLKEASKCNDEPTIDLLVTLQANLEKQSWMLRAYSAYE